MFAAYEEIAAANYAVAFETAGALEATEGAYDALLHAARLQSELAVFREEMLRRERAEHTQDTWFYRTIIVIGAVLVAI